MRVVYVHPFAQQLSGPDESLLALLEPLVLAGVEAHLVVPHLGPLTPRYEALGVTIHVQPLTILHRGIHLAEATLFGPRLLAQTVRLAALVRKIRADVLHTNVEVVLEGGLAAQLAGIPHVLHYRGNSLDSPRRLFDILAFFWIRLADRVFCISRATAEIFRRRGHHDKVEVLYNPLRISAFQSAQRSDDVRASLGAAPGQPLVITMGRIHPRKDMMTFVRACARVAKVVPEARFAIVGSAESPSELDYRARVTSLVEREMLGNRLTFAGARTDVPEVMKAADIFVLASRHEGFGRVVAEAMAAGTPVVATREGALPELMEEPSYGLGADPEDDAGFSAQILGLVNHPAERRRLGLAAAQRATQFDARLVAERVLTCYQSLMERKPRASQNQKLTPIL